jgi:hypothetical protein
MDLKRVNLSLSTRNSTFSYFVVESDLRFTPEVTLCPGKWYILDEVGFFFLNNSTDGSWKGRDISKKVKSIVRRCELDTFCFNQPRSVFTSAELPPTCRLNIPKGYEGLGVASHSSYVTLIHEIAVPFLFSNSSASVSAHSRVLFNDGSGMALMSRLSALFPVESLDPTQGAHQEEGIQI